LLQAGSFFDIASIILLLQAESLRWYHFIITGSFFDITSIILLLQPESFHGILLASFYYNKQGASLPSFWVYPFFIFYPWALELVYLVNTGLYLYGKCIWMITLVGRFFYILMLGY
jgi:hypothetical protein